MKKTIHRQGKYMDFFKLHIHGFIEFAVIIIFVTLSIKLVDFIDKKLRENIIKKYENSTRLLSFCPILNRIIKTLILFIIVASVMQAHGYSMTSLIAGFGIVGMAVSFAAKESIANVFGSFAILYDQIFDLGDYVIINDIEGTVVDINLRSTKIKTLDNSIIILPNNVVANAVVTNISAIPKRRIDEVIGVTYDTPTEKIERAVQILKDVLRNNDEVETNDSLVYIEKLNSSSIDIHMQAYVNYGDVTNFRRIRENVIMEILKQYRQEGIEFAFPSQSIYLANEN